MIPKTYIVVYISWEQNMKIKKTNRNLTEEGRRKGRIKALESCRIKWNAIYESNQYHLLSTKRLRKKVIEEQNNKCNRCKNEKWLEEPIYLELHHKDGNKKNKSRENLEALCLNCHQQTDKYRFNGRKHSGDLSKFCKHEGR
jgi:hypothetical protein